MEKAKLDKFFELLGELISEDGPWIEKKKALVAASTEDDRINLSEFVGWFDTEDT